MGIKKAFDKIAEDYDATRKILIPCFDEFYGVALDLIPFNPKSDIKVLDLGAGTGLFSSFVSNLYPNAEFTLFDISDRMLEMARKRFSKANIKVKYVVKDYIGEPFDENYDLIISALSIHHLTDGEKEKLFRKLYFSLNNNGIFINADQVLGESPYIDGIYKSVWLEQIKDNGVTADVLSSALERMKEDKMSTLANQLNWMKQAYFMEVNCWYQNYSFVVYSGIKK
jgi:tRNA (cmo5U34)-methyltransferase